MDESGFIDVPTRLRDMKLAVNKDFTPSSFDLHGKVGFDGPAEPG
jgi:hypothetical protein